jgi:hypothetical protein
LKLCLKQKCVKITLYRSENIFLTKMMCFILDWSGFLDKNFAKEFLLCKFLNSLSETLIQTKEIINKP